MLCRYRQIIFKEDSVAVREAIKTEEFSILGEIIKSKKNSKNNKSKFVTAQDVLSVAVVSCLAFFLSGDDMSIPFFKRFVDFNGIFNWNNDWSFTAPGWLGCS